MIPLTDKDIRRFWAKVLLPDSNGCMLWTDKPNKAGYGVMWAQGKNRRVHRVSLLLAEGLPPSPQHEAAHSCRSRHCAAPAHLRWSTRKDNSDDRVKDGTVPAGEKNGNARLTATEVAEIRSAYSNGQVSQKNLGQRYGIGQTTVSDIVNGRRWDG